MSNKEDKKNPAGEQENENTENIQPISGNETPVDEKNAAGESKVHVEEMKKDNGTETLPEEGKAYTETPQSPGTETHGSTESEEEVIDIKNAAGQSKVKTDLERDSDRPH